MSSLKRGFKILTNFHVILSFCSDCNALGMESGKIADSQLESSNFDNPDDGTHYSEFSARSPLD